MLETSERRLRGDAPSKPTLLILDDWLATLVKLRSRGEEFVARSLTVFVKSGFTPVFVLHSDTRDAWGLSRLGSGLARDVARVHVAKSRDGNRAYGIVEPGAKVRTVEGKLVFERFGFVPTDQPTWPACGEHTGAHTASHTGGKTGIPPEERAEEPRYARPGMRTCTGRVVESAPARLPYCPPNRIQVRDSRGTVRVYRLSLEGREEARRVYDMTGSLRKVLAVVDVKGSKQVRLTIAKALLGISDGSWRPVA